MRKSRSFGAFTIAVLVALAFVPACIQTCESTASSSVMTSGTRAQMTAKADGSGFTEVGVELMVGGPLSNVYLSLDGDDQLVAAIGKQRQTLTRRTDVLGRVWYVGSIKGEQGDDDLVVSYQRTVDKGAPRSVVRMPAGFDVISPQPGMRVSRGNDDLVIAWDKPSSSDVMEVSLEGNCIRPFSSRLEVDKGQLLVPRATLGPPSSGAMQPMEPAGDSSGAKAEPQPVQVGEPECRVTARFRRRADGKVDPGYGQGGSITAEQVREVTFVSTP
ncbi:MAG: hypothetical protein JRF63_03570 [Deltaproteobacteria bacterium]|nr:hypothetical protein [Deltaproteobacteria bacterium]